MLTVQSKNSSHKSPNKKLSQESINEIISPDSRRNRGISVDSLA